MSMPWTSTATSLITQEQLNFTSDQTTAELPPNESEITAGHGTFSVIFWDLGTFVITVTDTVTEKTGTSDGITLAAGEAVELVVTAPTMVGNGVAFLIEVQAIDAYGVNTLTGEMVFTFTCNGENVTATLPENTMLIGGHGWFWITLSTGPAGGNATITVSEVWEEEGVEGISGGIGIEGEV